MGLIVALIVVSLTEKSQSSFSKSLKINQFQLIEINAIEAPEEANVFGVINAEVTTDVKMKVGGKIDHDNRSLKQGSTFKKNDVLIKVDRLAVLYELLISRLNYKKHIQESVLEIGEQFPKEKSKWQQFEKKIERTLPLPELPKTVSKEEEQLLNELEVYSLYYKIKKIERNAEDYIYVAPFDGFVAESTTGPGLSIKENTLLLKLSKSNSLQVTAHLPVHSVRNYELADSIYFVNSKKDTLGKGHFKRTGQFLSDSSTIAVFFSISPQILLPENATVQIVLDRNKTSKGVQIPRTAIKNNKTYIFLDNKIITTPVEVISTQNDSVRVKGLPSHCFVIAEADKLDK